MASPAPPSAAAAAAASHPQSQADDPYFAVVESLGRISVAGFGGALAGLSFARRGGGASASRQAAAALNKTARAAKDELAAASKSGAGAIAKAPLGVAPSASKRGSRRLPQQRPVIRSAPPTARPYADRDLPLAWAVACTVFAGIVEFTRKVSPTSVILDLANGESESGVDGTTGGGAPTEDGAPADGASDLKPSVQLLNGLPLDHSMITISDYAIGGAFAGALFRGSAVRTKVGARLDSSMMGGTASATTSSAIIARPLSGILPGAALGLIAGIAIVAMDWAQVAVEEHFGQFDGAETVEEYELLERENVEPIPDDIKAMSNEELMKSIESLRGGRGETNRQTVANY
ncbi:hypothetical protein ACHAXT_004393 [Thalassiosira profunda]